MADEGEIVGKASPAKARRPEKCTIHFTLSGACIAENISISVDAIALLASVDSETISRRSTFSQLYFYCIQFSYGYVAATNSLGMGLKSWWRRFAAPIVAFIDGCSRTVEAAKTNAFTLRPLGECQNAMKRRQTSNGEQMARETAAASQPTENSRGNENKPFEDGAIHRRLFSAIEMRILFRIDRMVSISARFPLSQRR